MEKPEITRFWTVGHAAWGASWNGGDGLKSCCGNVSVDEKNSSREVSRATAREIGKDVGLQTVNSNPMLEKIRSGWEKFDRQICGLGLVLM